MQKKCPELNVDYIKFISYDRSNDEPRYSANYAHWFVISVHKCHSSDLIFKNNHGNSSSGELYYSPQSGQSNYDDTIFRASHRNCSVKKCSEKFCKIHKKTPVSESPYWKGDSDTGAFLFFCEFSEIFINNLFTEHLRETTSVFYWRKKNMLFTLGWKEQRGYDTVISY